MITVPWWVLPALFFAGVGFALFLASIWRAHIDAQILARTPEPQPEPDPVPQLWQAPTPPWADHQLAVPAAPDVDTSWQPFGIRPDGTNFGGEPTVSFSAVGFTMPGPAPKAVDDDPGPGPRPRFAEPEPQAPPVVKTLTVTLPDKLAPNLPSEVITSQIEVPAP